MLLINVQSRQWGCVISGLLLIGFLPARRYASAGNRHSNVSVCPSVSKRRKLASWFLHHLVFRRQISSPNSKGFPLNRGLKQGWVGKIQRFSTFRRQYLENGSRYGQSYYYWLIGSRTWAFDWHQDRWPWMTLNSITLNFQRISRDFADFGRNNS